MSVSLSNIQPAPGSRHRRKLLGRGEGTGHGQTATRGMKGQRSRSGDSRMVGFEGGQVSLLRRLPKRGFNNAAFRRSYELVHLDDLERYFSAGDTVTVESLKRLRLIRGRNRRVKLLGPGKLTKSLTVYVEAASQAARLAVEKAGGKIEAPAQP